MAASVLLESMQHFRSKFEILLRARMHLSALPEGAGEAMHYWPDFVWSALQGRCKLSNVRVSRLDAFVSKRSIEKFKE
jgi:hypothetical protein